MEKSKVNPFSIDHIVVNVEEYYQKDPNFIEKVNSHGLPYVPEKGKSTKGFQASNLWIGDEYFELIHIKTKDGGGWIKDWVNKYHSGHRGVIGVFLKTENIDHTSQSFAEYGVSEPTRISFRLFFNLIKLSVKWRNAYLPFFNKCPFQLGFQQVDDEKIEKRMIARMSPNSKSNGIIGISAIKYYGPFDPSEFEWLKKAFSCIEHGAQSLEIPLLNSQSIQLYVSKEVKTEVDLLTENVSFSPVAIEDMTILSCPLG